MRSRHCDDSLATAIELARGRRPGFEIDDMSKMIRAARTPIERVLSRILSVAFMTMMRPSEIVSFRPATLTMIPGLTSSGERRGTVVVLRRKTERTAQAHQRAFLWGKYIRHARAACTMLRMRGVENLGELFGLRGEQATARLRRHVRELARRAGVPDERAYSYACRHGGAEYFAKLDPLLLRIQGYWAANSTVPQTFYQGGSATRALDALSAHGWRGILHPKD
jgi:integrase